jgi:cell shape-determining protein MreC
MLVQWRVCDMSDEQKQAEIDLMKEMVTEIRGLRERVESLEAENRLLSKSIDEKSRMVEGNHANGR